MTWRRLGTFLAREWERRRASVNHRAVARQVWTESEVTAGYFLLLTLANLIALSGLLANSIPAIIGAMLISPLMGPILSFGFGFITGDTTVLRQSVRKIGLSIVLTLAVAAAASYLSPLQIATPEILARTKPNLFDLFIAVFAGIAGALALCTKRSVLTIVPGVAIATAVIPPLSVAGYGLGTAQWAISWGGFFLFFTNFVAITLTTCAVFLAYGFKPGEGMACTPNAIRNRMVALAAVLALISVPLVLTLRGSILELKDRRAIRGVLQGAFDHEKRSKVSAFSHRVLEDGSVAVSAVVNTTEYLSQEEVAETERRLQRMLDRSATLYLEQIKTLPGGVAPSPPAPVRVRAPGEVLAEARRDSLETARKALARLGGLMAPARITGYAITFGAEPPSTSLQISLKRDLPLSEDELRWVERFLTEELQHPVRVEIGLQPMLDPLVFLPGETALTPEHEALLLEAGRLFAAGAGTGLRLESHTDSAGATQSARRRLESAARFLVEAAGVPEGHLSTALVRDNAGSPRITLWFFGAPAPDPPGGLSTQDR